MNKNLDTFEILTAVTKTFYILRDKTPYSPIKISLHLALKYGPYLQGRRAYHVINVLEAGSKQSSVSCPFLACGLLGLLFDSEDAGGIILRNVGSPS
jgi:hypothetical protein